MHRRDYQEKVELMLKDGQEGKINYRVYVMGKVTYQGKESHDNRAESRTLVT